MIKMFYDIEKNQTYEPVYESDHCFPSLISGFQTLLNLLLSLLPSCEV